jgi:hypothetical protein
MVLPKGIHLSNGNNKAHVLKLIKNLYGHKQAGRVWNQHLARVLKKAGSVTSKVDDCVFYKGNIVSIVYVDDCIFFLPDLKEIEQAMKDLETQGLTLDMMGDVKDYLRINFERLPDGSIKMSQQQLIEKIIVWVSVQGQTPRVPHAVCQLCKETYTGTRAKGNFTTGR